MPSISLTSDSGRNTTHADVPMIFWQAELLMNRFALPTMAISIALPTRSRMSNSSSALVANSRRSGGAPAKIGQAVVQAVASSSVESAWSRRERMASISHLESMRSLIIEAVTYLQRGAGLGERCGGNVLVTQKVDAVEEKAKGH